MTWLLITWFTIAAVAAVAAGRIIRRREDDEAAARARPKLAFAELPGDGRRGSGDMLALDRLLGLLEWQEPRLAQVAMLRWIGGLSPTRAAAVLGIAPFEVERDLARARDVLRGGVHGSRGA